jgi:transposase InsO family protein
MPWKASTAVTERTRFALEWERRWREAKGGRVDVAELCRVFGISRQTGYLWIRRFTEAGHDVRALEDRSRRPLHSPTAVPQEMQDFIVDARRQKPRWGPRTLRSWLVDRYPGRSFPSASTFAEILRRHGLTSSRRHRQRARVPRSAEPLGTADAPNSIWCIDFKGHFATGDGARCYPLTMIDAFSRFCIRCEIVPEQTGRCVERVLDSSFREFGLPAAIRSDNGPPFAAAGPAGLSQLAVWLLRLGLRLERIAPGCPQQNGRQERFHRTLHDETARPPAPNLRAQQRAFDFFRAEYNHVRPHQALQMRTPAAVYVPSSRRYPRPLVEVEPAAFGQTLRVERDGTVRWGRVRVFVSSALSGERVQVMPDGDTRWTVTFGSIELGYIDDRKLAAGLEARARSRKPHFLELSGMSSG